MIKKLQTINHIIQIVIILFFIIGFFPFNYLIDGINHMRPFLLCGLGASLSLSVNTYGFRKALLLLLVGLLLNLHISPSLLSFKSKEDKPTLSVLHINLQISNTNYEDVKELIIQEDADIISLQECTNIWFKKLAPLLQKYTITEFVDDSPFGICVASKIPVMAASVEKPKDNTPYIKLKLKQKDTEFYFYSMHPTPPFNQKLFKKRNRFFKQFTDSEVGEKAIIAGDLNCTQWSPYYHSFVKKLRVKNTLPPTAMTWQTASLFKVMQLDHILVSKGMSYKQSAVLHDIGSDHFPILCEIYLPQ